jgi:SAM-dependent methyltransferase
MASALLELEGLEGLGDGVLVGLRRALEAHGFDSAFIGRTEQIAPNQLDQIRLPAVRCRLRAQGGGAAVLARLFAYSDRVAAAEAASVFPAAIHDALLGAGLLVREGDEVRGAARLMPFEGVWILSDEMNAPGDPVMGAGATTLFLARAARVVPGAAVLDVGCGAGTLALYAAARGAGAVVGVDLAERALRWSRINARMNGLAATFLQGDLFAPVEGRRFDLIVSQPPYVVATEGTEATTYLHGGRLGDELAMRILAEVPALLAPGGRAFVLFDSPVLEGASVEQRLRAAIGDHGLGAFAVVAQGLRAEMQAIAYSSVRHPALDAAYAVSVEAYLAHLAAIGSERGLHVVVELVRPPEGAAVPTVIVEVPSLLRWDAAAFEGLEAGVGRAISSDQDLLGSAVAIAPGAWLAQESALGGGGHRIKLRFERGRANETDLSDAAAVLVESVLGGGTVADVVARFAQRAGARPEEVRPQVLQFIREGLVSGLLGPGA